jgi:phospholipid/cholesterol/gamma-HCH transport system substrate-binding protein
MASTSKALKFSQLRVGVFVLFGLAVLAFLILNSSGDFNPFEKKIHLKARFAAADGLREGSEVLLAGVHIGKVEQVILLPPDSPEEFKIEALMSVQKELDGRLVSDRIRTDSTAQLVATSLLANDKMINISPGSSKGSSISENQVLESREAMSINQLTQTGNDLLQQINKLAVPANEILNKANKGQGTLGRVINDETLYKSLDSTVNEARATMTRLQTTIDKVNSGDGSAGKLLNDPALYNNLNKTVNQLESISNDIRAGKGTAGKFVNDDALYTETRAAVADLRVSAAKINDIADDFKVIAADLRDGKGTAGKFLKDEKLYEDAKNLIAKLDLMVNDAQAGKGTIGKLITDETLYNNINQTASNINQFSSEGTKLLYDFRQNPKKFLRIKLSIF